jgi:hypothetical protein
MKDDFFEKLRKKNTIGSLIRTGGFCKQHNTPLWKYKFRDDERFCGECLIQEGNNKLKKQCEDAKERLERQKEEDEAVKVDKLFDK